MFHVLTLTYLQPLDVIEQTRAVHVEWLKDEVAAGRIVLAGRQESQRGGVLITADWGHLPLAGDSAEEAQEWGTSRLRGTSTATPTSRPDSWPMSGWRSTAPSARRAFRVIYLTRIGD